MTKSRFFLRNVATIVASLAVSMMFSGCDPEEELSDEKQITAFSFTTPPATGVIDQTAKTIAVTVPRGTDVTALAPVIAHTGASVSPASGEAQNFTSPVPYTVTAEDKSTEQYTVTVTVTVDELQPMELISPITTNTTLKDLGLPIDYFFAGGVLEVKNNAILTIEDSVTIQFRQPNGRLDIIDGATLKAMGSVNKRIQFVGTADNKGSWAGIRINTVTANELNYTDILYAGSETFDYSAALYLGNGKAAIKNCLISGSAKNGLTIEGASGNYNGELTAFSDNTISNCDRAPVCTNNYAGCWSLRNIENNNVFTDNTNAYIDIMQKVNTYILSDMTLPSLNGFPWYFQSGLTIDADRKFTIEAGAVLLMGTGVQVDIAVPSSSHLIAVGTPTERITIKGFRNEAGYWDGIRVSSNSKGTKFNYCDISDAGRAGDGYILYMRNDYLKDAFVELNNTTFSNSRKYGLYLNDVDGKNYIINCNPSSVTFSSCPDGNIYSNCDGAHQFDFKVYQNLIDYCNLLDCDDSGGGSEIGDAVEYTDTRGNKINVPGGALSFATSVIDFVQGDPWTNDAGYQNPNSALGEPVGDVSNEVITLGAGGVITLGFSVFITDGPGHDIYVFEVGPAVEPTKVEVSNDLINWIYVGDASGSLSGVDINGKVPSGAKYKYVRLTDLMTDPDGSHPGADIDAVAVLHPVLE